MTASLPASRGVPWLRAAGALLAGLGVALSAYAAHGAEVAVRANLQTAALHAFGHGVALAALARGPIARLARLALSLLLAGSVLFAGSLAWKALAGGSSAAAPFGGGLVLLGWLLYAIAALRD
ncbi:DUF423 domain-containing protein [Luteimonas kalidii]|uniref:DUF423 domain-containing protein n=1 Tax=Luteimonas kalidii TaxID=3042025 RepID=A0ABT6JW14_9GAMM|nr:DUF423 domain-containing protein [Luteimonas kalidii]MDH5834889.1 DUF423 domain-containing protein [Luteimonas kalidii]